MVYLEVKSLIAIEHQDKATKLVTQSFHRLSLPCASGTLKKKKQNY